MKLIIGLGNPEAQYHHTRHNTGFILLDAYFDSHPTKSCQVRTPKPVSLRYQSGALFLKPQDSMNLSGDSVGAVVRTLDLKPEDLLLIHDDLDFALGNYKLKQGGGSGRHNGVQSVIDALGTTHFSRFRVGIGRPTDNTTTIDWVLSDFSYKESQYLCELCRLSNAAIETFILKGPQALQEFNQ